MSGVVQGVPGGAPEGPLRGLPLNHPKVAVLGVLLGARDSDGRSPMSGFGRPERGCTLYGVEPMFYRIWPLRPYYLAELCLSLDLGGLQL